MVGYTTVSADEFEKMMEATEAPEGELMPAFAVLDAAVCIVSSNEYAPFAAVVIQSIIDNASDEKNYDLVILSDDMSSANKRRIIGQAADHPNISVRIVDITKYIEGYDFYTWAHFTPNTYYRLLTPDIFACYSKVIYMDSDVAVNRDIAELYATDLTDYLLAAAYDTHVVSYCTRQPPLEQRTYNMETLNMGKPEQYFQCGVSLYNINEIQKHYPKGYLIKQAAKHQLRWLDQDLVNMLFYGRIKRLPNFWNVMISNYPPDIDEYHLPEDLREEYYKARLDPGIVHYVGHAIPCYTTTPDLYEYFWQHARKTCFYEVLLQRLMATTVSSAVSDAGTLGDQAASLEQRLAQIEKDWPYLTDQHVFLCSEYERIMKKMQKRPLARIKRLCRRAADALLPKGTRRREWVKKLLGRG